MPDNPITSGTIEPIFCQAAPALAPTGQGDGDSDGRRQCRSFARSRLTTSVLPAWRKDTLAIDAPVRAARSAHVLRSKRVGDKSSIGATLRCAGCTIENAAACAIRRTYLMLK